MRTRPVYRLALVIAGVAAASCGGSSIMRTPDARHEPDAARALLRQQVARDPGDEAAHAALGRLELEAARPGAALRHLERAGDALTAEDRRALASLYMERLRARVAAGDGSAYGDAERARALGARVEPALWVEARFLGALHALRRGQSWDRASVDAHLGAARALAPEDPRLAQAAPGSAPLPALARAGLWLMHGGAMRAAMTVLDAYVTRGGRDAEALRAFVAVRRWWGDTDGRGVDGELRYAIAGAGVSLCPLAARMDEPGCASTLGAVARGPAWFAREVRARAAALAWRTSDPDEAAAWTLLALRGWLAGEGGFAALAHERVDVAAAVAHARPGALPRGTAAALLRLAGRTDEAGRALADAMARAADPGTDPGDRLVILAEAALAGAADDTVDALLGEPLAWMGPDQAPGALWDEALRVAVLHAAAAGNDQRAVALAARASSKGTERALRRDAGVPAVEDHAALVRVLRGALERPDDADALAADFVDGHVYAGERAPVVAALFAALGDTGRAAAWWETLVESVPGPAHHELELGLAVARSGDTHRASVHLMAATARSGNAGAMGLVAARALLAAGQPLAALAQARGALALTASLDHDPILHEAIAAATRLGRVDEASALRRALRVPEAARAAPAELAAPRSSDVEHVLASVGETPSAEHVARLVAALAWNPADARTARVCLRALPAGDAASARAMGLILARLGSAGEGAEGAARARALAETLAAELGTRKDRAALLRALP